MGRELFFGYDTLSLSLPQLELFNRFYQNYNLFVSSQKFNQSSLPGKLQYIIVVWGGVFFEVEVSRQHNLRF